MGPNMDLTIRRNQLASDDMWKTACKQPKGYVYTVLAHRIQLCIHFIIIHNKHEYIHIYVCIYIYICIYTYLSIYLSYFWWYSVVAPKVKNMSRNSLGDSIGRLHVKKQNLDTIGGRRVTALRDTKRSAELIADQQSTSDSSSTKRLKR